MNRQETLEAALKCVCGEREQDYGRPEDNFAIIAQMWSAYIQGACGLKLPIEADDVAAMMALLKIARISSGNGKADNWVDLAGYAACGAELEERRCAHT